MKYPILTGKKVYLRPIEPEDIDRGWLEWINDPEISGNLNSPGYPTTKEDLKKYIENSKPPNAVMFGVCNKKDDKYIGNARISKIDWQHKKCTFGRLIGDISQRGKGVGSEVLYLILKYSFINLGMNRVYTLLFSDNEASIKSNENAGMKQEGTLRQAFYKNGSYKDVIVVSMLREDFDKLSPQDFN